jgi:hypothetical protein
MSENAGYKAFTAGTDLAAGRRVKLQNATTTTPPQVVYAGAGEQHLGVTTRAVASGALVSVRLRTVPGSVEIEAAASYAVGALLYGAADGKVSGTAVGSAIGVAVEAAASSGALVEVVEFGVLSTTAATVSIADTGSFTATGTVEAALAEIYQGLLSTQHIHRIPMGSLVLGSTGAPLAVFADGASATPGLELTNSKAICVRWNNHATPTPVGVAVAWPKDMDETKDVVFHALVSKTGATAGDATSLTIAAYEQIPNALHDADTNFGGVSTAVTATAIAKTVTELTRTLAAVDVHAPPGSVTLLFGPTAGTLGTDDFLLHNAWLEYTPKLLTS